MSYSSDVEKLIHLHKFPINPHVTFGNRLFIPKGTEDEKETVKNGLDKLFAILDAERVEKKKVRSTAEWLPEMKRAKFIKRMGHAAQFGYKKDKDFFLLPEEALFLIEMNRLELFLNGIPLSIEQAYVNLLGKDTCSIKQYRVYQNLAQQGFEIKNTEEYQKLYDEENSESNDQQNLKNDSPNKSSPTTSKKKKNQNFDESYAKKLKLDESQTMQIKDRLCCYNLYSSDKKLTHKLKLQSAYDPLSNENISTNEYSVITCFSENDSVAFYKMQQIKGSHLYKTTFCDN